MVFNYIKIAVRYLIKHKGFSFINIAGLAIGMTCSLFILLWVQDELSFDKFQRDVDRMYRVNIHLPDMDVKAAVSDAPMAEAAQQEIPEIQQAIRLSMNNNDLMQVGDKVFEESGIVFADSNFLSFFTFPLIEGDPKTALDRPASILLTEQMAIKYFGTTKVVGQTIQKSNRKQDLTITGVLAPIPHNSHLQFDFIEPMSTIAKTNPDLATHRWDNFGWYTYLKLNQPATAGEVSKINARLDEVYHEHEKNMKIHFFLEPVTSIHFTPGLLVDVPGITDRQYVYVFSVVGIFILVVACINFMNLATARSARRAKEVGLRKVAGAFRSQLIGQFLAESTIIALVALIIALALTGALLPMFNGFSGKTVSLSLLDPMLVAGLLAITVITGLLAGSYPAIFLSRFMPAKVLKGELRSGASSGVFRNAMVVVQFSVSIMLLVGTTVVFQQMQFISHRNLGYDKENLVYIPVKGDLGKDVTRLKTLLESHEATRDFSFASAVPTNLANGTINVDWDGKDPNAQPLFPNMAVDENFIDVFKMTLLSGRSFSRDIKADTANYMVNEEALKIMNMTPENAIGKRLGLFGINGTIVGVVKNFNFKPVQTAVEPMIMQMNPGYGLVVVRVKPGQLDAAVAELKKICMSLNPRYPFSYEFVDKDLERMYQSEQRLGSLFSVFAGLGLFISCLGLYGLSAFLAERRTKEIGVRKVLGASAFSITWLLSMNFTRPILVAATIAIPLSWYATNKWLESFVYRVGLGWETFAIAFAICLLIAWLTVSYETIRAALTNPSRSLRTE